MNKGATKRAAGKQGKRSKVSGVSQPPSDLIVLREPDEKERRGRRNSEFPTINIRATAAKMGVTESHLSRLLTRKTRPSFRMAIKLANAFNITLEQIERIYDKHNNRERFKLAG